MERVTISNKMLRVLRYIARHHPEGHQLARFSLRTVYALIDRGYIGLKVGKWVPTQLGWNVQGDFSAVATSAMFVQRPVPIGEKKLRRRRRAA